ncbi:MAG: hypothetical protein K2J06_00090 [Muribaculaceae bacterium]|nr:hypothetical protein [Muribaculaceae bacterium]
MARHYSHIIAVTAFAALTIVGCSSRKDGDRPAEYSKRERNLINEGSKHYRDSDLRKADVAFQKALAENPDNPYAQYNSALTHLGLASVMAENATDSIKTLADSAFMNIAKNTLTDTLLRENSIYNSGNIAFTREDYRRSIELYKQILRADTANREALENLRLAQLRIPPEDENNQNQDNKQDQNQQQQDQQDQNKDQNKDQNQDQNKDNKDQNQDQNQDQDQQDKNQNSKPKPEDQDKKPQDRQDGSMSAANAQQILDAMEKKEAATRQRFENMKADEERKANANASTLKPW